MIRYRCAGVLVLCVVFFSCGVSAIGLTSVGERFIFEEGVLFESSFGVVHVANDVDVEYSLEGDLAGFGWIEETGNYSFKVSFLFNESLSEPGEHVVYVKALEVPRGSSGATVMTATAARVPIKFFVPYDSMYLGVELDVSDLRVGKNYGLGVDVSNLGSYFLEDVEGEVVVELNGEVVESLDLGMIDLEIGEEFSWNFDVKLERAGSYDFYVDVYYAGKVEEVEESVVVGERGLIVNDFAGNIEVGDVGKFWIEVENDWSEGLDEVWFDFDLFDGNGNLIGGIESERVAVGGYGEKVLVGFVDLSGVEEGRGRIEGFVYFDGEELEFSEEVKLGSSFSWTGVNGLAVYGFVWVLFLFVFRKFRRRGWDEG